MFSFESYWKIRLGKIKKILELIEKSFDICKKIKIHGYVKLGYIKSDDISKYNSRDGTNRFLRNISQNIPYT